MMIARDAITALRRKAIQKEMEENQRALKEASAIHSDATPYLRKQQELLAMLKSHAAASDDFDRSVDPDPYTLVFATGQESSPPPAGRQKVTPPARTTGEPAKVFVRLRIYAPGKTESLLVPAFPVKAPSL